MAQKKSTPLANQPFFIQFVYLDLSNKEALNAFLKSIKQPALQAFKRYFSMRYLNHYNLNLAVNLTWQSDILEFLTLWYERKVAPLKGETRYRSTGYNKWLSERLPYTEIVSLSRPDLSADLVIGLNNINLMGFFAIEISEALKSGRQLKKCEAEDCDHFFIATRKGKEQRYCSTRCRKREYMREYYRSRKNP